MTKFKLAPLPYDYSALEPHISAETMHFHHDQHHAAYVEKVNKLVEGTEFEPMSLEEIIRKTKGRLLDNAAQAWNHDFYWQCLKPSGGDPKGPLREAIDRDFGSPADFLAKFQKDATELFGSGWVWLVSDGQGKLSVTATQNAHDPLETGTVALLAWDVWEHAYYIDYRNDRAKHLQALTSIINWDFAARNYEKLRVTKAA